jgi:hypothetical protein
MCLYTSFGFFFGRLTMSGWVMRWRLVLWHGKQVYNWYKKTYLKPKQRVYMRRLGLLFNSSRLLCHPPPRCPCRWVPLIRFWGHDWDIVVGEVKMMGTKGRKWCGNVQPPTNTPNNVCRHAKLAGHSEHTKNNNESRSRRITARFGWFWYRCKSILVIDINQPQSRQWWTSC